MLGKSQFHPFPPFWKVFVKNEAWVQEGTPCSQSGRHLIFFKYTNSDAVNTQILIPGFQKFQNHWDHIAFLPVP